MTDIEIANSYKMKKISDVAKDLNINEDFLEYYGKYKAKIDLKILDNLKNRKGKLILVTSINPTPYGEGKTTISIGIYDAFKRLKRNALVVLREPSLGPVFGIKGGATGGGRAQIVPMEDINLHFTGDIHAITSANNLLSAAIDNHIFQGNELKIDKNNITFERCMDMNDRALRSVEINHDGKCFRNEKFNITAASEMMAILCLAKDVNDLRKRIDNIVFGYDVSGQPLFVKDLKVTDAMCILLKDAIKPNIVQTLEGNPALVHGGPFANIAHGCNSLIATDLALRLSDYVITEAGFGADLGAEKFLDLKCRVGELKPSAIVINVTIRSLKYDFDSKNEDDIAKGIDNLKIHIENMKKYIDNVIVCLNKFENDLDEDILMVKGMCELKKIPFTVCDSFSKGSDGSIEAAKLLIESLDSEYDFNYLYDVNDDIKSKIENVITNIYRSSKITYTDFALQKIKDLERHSLDKYPIAIAKSQYVLGVNKKFVVKDIKLQNGAGFITVYLDDIMTMPGLSKKPAYMNMKIDKEGNISGLF